MKAKLALAIGSVALLAGCATSLHRGVVAMKVDDSIAHVGLNKGEAAAGDHVQLYGNQCTPRIKGEARTCTKVQKGHGTVTEVLGDNYVAVKFEPGVKFEEGDFIEKHSH
jgi:hypothetical protein